MTFCLNVSRFMNLAAIFSLDLESQCRVMRTGDLKKRRMPVAPVRACPAWRTPGHTEYTCTIVMLAPRLLLKRVVLRSVRLRDLVAEGEGGQPGQQGGRRPGGQEVEGIPQQDGLQVGDGLHP